MKTGTVSVHIYLAPAEALVPGHLQGVWHVAMGIEWTLLSEWNVQVGPQWWIDSFIHFYKLLFFLCEFSYLFTCYGEIMYIYWGIVHLQYYMFHIYKKWFIIFKCYIPFIFITKYWLYSCVIQYILYHLSHQGSLCALQYILVVYFIHNSLYFLILVSLLPLPMPPVTTTLFFISVSLFFFVIFIYLLYF